MQSKTVQTRHAPVRYLEGGAGEPLVFFHGAGGMTENDPILAELSSRFHVYAPFIPGYGETEECESMRDMLDFALHGWDVVEALGLKNPILVGHSMGGMIAAEMAALAPNDVSRLALICPAGLWLDDHPIVDVFATLPFEMPALMFHDAVAGVELNAACTGDSHRSCEFKVASCGLHSRKREFYYLHFRARNPQLLTYCLCRILLSCWSLCAGVALGLAGA